MSGIFDDLYADAYDVIYREKDYAGEAANAAELIARHGGGTVRSIVDLGCGTGKHGFLLAESGFDVVGLDQSEAMLARARARKAGYKGKGKIDFAAADIRNFDLGRRFDAALMMFNVLGYMTTNADLVSALRAIRRHLRDDGLFICDIWYGPAIVRDPPGDRLKEFGDGRRTLRRVVTAEHDPHRQLCDLSISMTELHDNVVVKESKEHHRVRYFFPLELELALRLAGMRLIGMRSFSNIAAEPGVDEWPAMVIAAADRVA
jgi:SAM-dependent methyltransferase